jgi:hypothetical protein
VSRKKWDSVWIRLKGKNQNTERILAFSGDRENRGLGFHSRQDGYGMRTRKRMMPIPVSANPHQWTNP